LAAEGGEGGEEDGEEGVALQQAALQLQLPAERVQGKLTQVATMHGGLLLIISCRDQPFSGRAALDRHMLVRGRQASNWTKSGRQSSQSCSSLKRLLILSLGRRV